MGRDLAVGANLFARKWFEPVDRANKFAPTKPLTAGFRIVRAVRAQLVDGSTAKQLVSLLDRETYAGKTCWRLPVMGQHLAVGANSFARKWFVPVSRANKFAPTTAEARAVHDERIGATLSQELVRCYDRGEWEMGI